MATKKKAKTKVKAKVKAVAKVAAKKVPVTMKGKHPLDDISKFHSKNAKPRAAAAPQVDTTLLDSLLAATGELPPGKTESLKDFCYRLFVKMAEVPDDAFKKLPKEARDWYDATSDLYNAEKFSEMTPLPGMPGAELKQEQAEEAEQAVVQEPTNEGQENTEETNVTKAKGKNKGMKASAAPKAPKVAKEKGERKPQTESVSYKMRSVVVKNPLITFEKAADACGLKGKAAAEGSHAFNYYNHARIVIAMFKEHAGIK